MTKSTSRRAVLRAFGCAAIAPLCTSPALAASQPCQLTGSIDHANYRVTDLDRSARFYAAIFGPAVKRSTKPIIANLDSVPTDHYWIRMGASYLALSEAEGNGGVGFDHFCLALSPATMPLLRERLEAAEARFSSSPPGWVDGLWSKDPGGNICHLIDRPEGYWDLLEKVAGAELATDIAAESATPVCSALSMQGLMLASGASEARAVLDYYATALDCAKTEAAEQALAMGNGRLEVGDESVIGRITVAVGALDRAELARRARRFGARIGAATTSHIDLRDPDGMAIRLAR